MQALAAAGPHARECDLDSIATAIRVVGGMQRLVQVPDQVHDPLQGLVARARRRRGSAITLLRRFSCSLAQSPSRQMAASTTGPHTGALS